MNHVSEEARQVHHDVKHCDADELLDLHGIELREDGSVYDHTYHKEYKSVTDWLESTLEDDDVGFEKFSKHFEEDYF